MYIRVHINKFGVLHCGNNGKWFYGEIKAKFSSVFGNLIMEKRFYGVLYKAATPMASCFTIVFHTPGQSHWQCFL